MLMTAVPMGPLISRLVILIADLWIYLARPRLVRRFRKKLGVWPRAGCPRTYWEKMLWRKMYDRNPLFTTLSDKLKAKDFARARCADILIPRTLWQGECPGDIPAALLGRRVVVKANHGYGFNAFVDGSSDRGRLEARANRWLQTRHGVREGEWAYFGVDRKVFVEEALLDGDQLVSTELKFHVFGGTVFLCSMIVDRALPSQTRSCAFDRNGRSMGRIGKFGNAESEPLPACFGDAVRNVEVLCRGIDYVRCDVYPVGESVYFGEFTVYPDAGFVNFRSAEIMSEMGSRWDLTMSWLMSSRQRGLRRVYAWALRQRLSVR